MLLYGAQTTTTQAFNLDFPIDRLLLPDPSSMDAPVFALGYDPNANFPPIISYNHPYYRKRMDTIDGILDTTETSVDVHHYSYYEVGDIIKINNEKMHVTAITPGSGELGTLTVERHYQGTSAGEHADNDDVFIMSNSRKENTTGLITPSYRTPGSLVYNYGQKFEITKIITEDMQAVEDANWVIYSLAQEMELKTVEQLRKIELQCLIGDKFAGDANEPPSMGGIINEVQTNITTPEDGKLTLNVINQAISNMKEGGAKVDTIILHHDTMREIVAAEWGTQRFTSRLDSQAGIYISEFLCYDNTVLKVIPVTQVPRRLFLMMSSNAWKVGPVAGANFKLYVDPPTADKDFTQISMRGKLNLRVFDEARNFARIVYTSVGE